MLGNLDGFETKQMLAYDDMLELDQWAVRLTANMQTQIEQAYSDFQFHSIYQRIHQFCVVDMGGFYLDILKDRLYTCDKSSHARLSAQTAMQHILESLVRSVAPILSFTAEEIWGHMTGEREQSVLFATGYQAFDDIEADRAADQRWQNIIEIRDLVSKQIEDLRGKGAIGSSLDAAVTIYADEANLEVLKSVGDELRFVLITSAAKAKPLAEAIPQAVDSERGLKILVTPSPHDKCVRCWHRRPEVGTIEAHPELCERCVTNIEGDGEIRQHA